MATGKTLLRVLQDTLAEIGMSQQSAMVQDARESLKRMIVNEQEQLIDDYDWLPFKDMEPGRFFDITLAAGQRYYDWPDDFDYKTLGGVWTLQGNVWQGVDYGITPAEYSAFNSDDDVRTDPVMRWDFYSEEQIELWPLPASVGSVRLKGRSLADEAVSESAVMVIDHIALSKFAAASYLRSKPDETGESRRLGDIRYAEGMKRINVLKARKNKHLKLSFARSGRMPDAMDPRNRILIAS